MKIDKFSIPFLAFLQSTALVIYIGFVSIIFVNGTKIFGSHVTIFAPLLFLLLFITSAVISALLFLGRAGYLFWEKRYKESFRLLGWTICWSAFYLAVIFLIILTNK